MASHVDKALLCTHRLSYTAHTDTHTHTLLPSVSSMWEQQAHSIMMKLIHHVSMQRCCPLTLHTHTHTHTHTQKQTLCIASPSDHQEEPKEQKLSVLQFKFSIQLYLSSQGRQCSTLLLKSTEIQTS